ncbi:hypothetical protein CWATWH8502_2404 [Crocosphaera watsonii WH 8502]|uniref:Uncharacterized protein n=1 Tax=Crocosphaera watsonii WH 8502 TaxID=423474 RepID=T2IDI1_CROWT|nr:hypothetical protein CWATWH8502_2404 [Crocosphaera watsonii WH 8502]
MGETGETGEMGRRGDGEMGRRGDGETGRRGDGGKFIRSTIINKGEFATLGCSLATSSKAY